MSSRTFIQRYMLGFFILLVLFAGVFFIAKHLFKTTDDFIREIRQVMGSYMTITAYFEDRQYLKKSIDQAFGEIKKIEALMTPFEETSELSVLNKAPKPGRYKVSDHIWNILNISGKLNEQTGGAFDVTVQPLYNLWKSAAHRNKLPTGEELAGALKSVGWNKIILHEDTKEVEFTVAGMELTFGGIASGYAVDLIANSFRKNGIQNFLIDEGGDIFCSGRPGKRSLWRIGVRDPLKKSNVIKVLSLTDMAVVTSGNYERYYKIGGKNYSQIFSPQTGLPVEQTVSTTVIAKDTVTSDGWATALMVLGADKGMQILRFKKDIEALIIYSDDGKLSVKSTHGFSTYESKSVK